MSTFTPKSEKELCFSCLDSQKVKKLSEIWDGTYDLEINRNVIDERVLVQDNELRAYGVLKEMAEAVIVLDKSISKRTQVQAIKMLFQQAIERCKELKIADLHAFTRDEKYAQLLIKHFGFNKVNGIPLILDLR